MLVSLLYGGSESSKFDANGSTCPHAQTPIIRTLKVPKYQFTMEWGGHGSTRALKRITMITVPLLVAVAVVAAVVVVDQ